MAQLPYFQTNDKDLNLLETKWMSILNPLLATTLVNGLFLPNVSLINGSTVINHKLGRMQLGWILTDINAGAAVYRSAPFNDKTLTLTSGAICMVSLWVF